MSDSSQGYGSWQPDPFGRYAQRWWDGYGWSAQVATHAGEVLADAPVASPAPVAPEEMPPVTAPLVPSQVILPQVIPPQVTPPQPAYPQYSPQMQTPSFNLPGGGPWAAPQQMVVTNASKSPGLAIASLVLGIGSFFIALIPIVGLTSIPFAIVGVALGISGIVRASKGFEGKGLSIAGLVSSVAALLVSCIYVFAIGWAAGESERINSLPSDGICNPNRFLEDPDC